MPPAGTKLTKPRRKFSVEEKERALTALVLASSSVQAEEVTGIPARTLRQWKTELADDYERIRSDMAPEIAKRVASDAEALARDIAEVERRLLARFDDATIASLPARDVSTSLRNLSVSKGLQIDKISSPLRERPSHVNHTADFEEIINKLGRQLGIRPEPVTDAVVIPAELESGNDSEPAG
jgi:transposase-like protein